MHTRFGIGMRVHKAREFYIAGEKAGDKAVQVSRNEPGYHIAACSCKCPPCEASLSPGQPVRTLEDEGAAFAIPAFRPVFVRPCLHGFVRGSISCTARMGRRFIIVSEIIHLRDNQSRYQ